METMGERLKLLRKHRNLKQAEVASAVGITQSSLSDLERGISSPSAETLISLSRYFTVSPEWLFTGEGPGPPLPEARAREPDPTLRLMAAVAALDKEEAQSYLKGEMPPEGFMCRVAELSGLPPPAVESLIQSMGRTNRPKKNEEAAAGDLPEEIKMLLRYWPELTEEQRKDLLAQATHYYGQRVASGKSGPSDQNITEKSTKSSNAQQAQGF